MNRNDLDAFVRHTCNNPHALLGMIDHYVTERDALVLHVVNRALKEMPLSAARVKAAEQWLAEAEKGKER